MASDPRTEEGRNVVPQEARISVVRVLVLLVLIPAVWLGVIQVSQPSVAGIVMLLGAYVIVLAVGARWVTWLRKPDLIISLDILVITLVVVISGVLHSPFLYLYYLAILEAAARLNLRQALAASVATAALVILLWTRAGQREALETLGFRLGAFIAGGFFLALFLGMLVQETRSARERDRWARLLDRRLAEATQQLEEQLEELRFYNDLASRLSGATHVDGVLGVLLQVFLHTTGLSAGAAYACTEEGSFRLAVARGAAGGPLEARDAGGLLPALPSDADGGGALLSQRIPADQNGGERTMTCLPVVRAGRPLAWICGMSVQPPPLPAGMRRRAQGIATQGASALEAARLYEEVQRMVNVDFTWSVHSWTGLRSLIDEEVRRSAELLLVFSIAEIRMHDYPGPGRSQTDEQDLALRRIILLVQRRLRRVDVLSHDGGGRFMLVLPRLPKIQAIELVRDIARKLETDSIAAQLLGVEVLRLSSGVATFPEDGTTADALMETILKPLLGSQDDLQHLSGPDESRG